MGSCGSRIPVIPVATRGFIRFQWLRVPVVLGSKLHACMHMIAGGRSGGGGGCPDPP